MLVRAQLDATVTSATADIYNNAGTLVLGGVILYDNGTHGDATAGDRIWTNDGSVAAQPSYTILSTDAVGANWRVRVFAPDASTSSIAANGLVHRPTSAQLAFGAGELLQHRRTAVYGVRHDSERHHRVVTVRDPINAAVSPKAIPGAWLEYTATVTNAGPGVVDANSVVYLNPIADHACDVCDVSLFGRRHTGAFRRFDFAGADRAYLQLR